MKFTISETDLCVVYLDKSSVEFYICICSHELTVFIVQELALYGEFTTKETMYYFGILNRMSCKAIQMRIQFLLELLELPQSNRLVRSLR